jgi:hypothetical protein
MYILLFMKALEWLSLPRGTVPLSAHLYHLSLFYDCELLIVALDVDIQVELVSKLVNY